MVKLPSSPRSAQTPPLESGDCLSRSEFERRYAADPCIKKAELIEGVVYVASPLRFQSHAEPHTWLVTWLSIYQIATVNTRLGIEPTVRLDQNNELQPDAALLIDPAAGGQVSISEDDYLEGAPELVIEIAASSAAIDLHSKKHVYRRNGVQEYIVWQIFENRLDWFHLQAGKYEPLTSNDRGVMQSKAFPGLWLATSALLQGEMQQVLAVLQEGLKSSEHQQFKQRMEQKNSGRSLH